MVDTVCPNMKEDEKALRSVKENAGGFRRIEGPVE